MPLYHIDRVIPATPEVFTAWKIFHTEKGELYPQWRRSHTGARPLPRDLWISAGKERAITTRTLTSWVAKEYESGWHFFLSEADALSSQKRVGWKAALVGSSRVPLSNLATLSVYVRRVRIWGREAGFVVGVADEMLIPGRSPAFITRGPHAGAISSESSLPHRA